MAHWRQSKHCGADVFLHVLRVWVSRRVSQSPTPKCGKKRSKSGGNFSNPEGCGLTLVPLLAVLIRGCCHLPGPIHALLEELWVPWPPTGTSQNVWAWLKGTHTSLTVSAIFSLCVSTCLNGGQSCWWWFCFVYFFSPFCLSLVVAFCLLCFCLLFLNSLSLCVAFFFFSCSQLSLATLPAGACSHTLFQVFSIRVSSLPSCKETEEKRPGEETGAGDPAQ